MLIYGKNVAKEVLKNNTKIIKIYLSKTFNDGEIQKLINKKKKKIIKKENYELNNLVKENHQGIILEIEDYKFYSINDIKENETFILMLDHLEDPHNFGAIIRTAECAGIKHIIIPNKRSVGVTASVMKTSAGALSNVKIISVTNLNNAINLLKKKGFWVVGAEANGEAYTNLDFSGKTVLVIGSEGKGLKKITKKNCDMIASIPLKGKINSLNASVASGILIYEILKFK